MKKSILVFFVSASAAIQAHAINILVDYTYDTNNFFNTQQKKDAMQAAADRFSAIITSPLLALDANYAGGSTDWRIGFNHPGTGASFQISTAANSGSDALIGGGAANVYNSAFTLPANTWRLFAGGRAGLGSAGVGGTGTGLNFTSVFDDLNGPMHRGLIPNTPANTVNDLPTWGGAISFDSGIAWHFDLATASPGGTTDFYSIALHEVGHALGLSTSWNQWQDNGAGTYTGAQAVAAFNQDNGLSFSGLSEVSPGNPHWADNTYDSFIFSLGGPIYVGTVGPVTKQDLLMEPIANFVNPTPLRFELTNVDVGALRDVGWATVVPEPTSALLCFAGALLSGVARRPRRI